MIIKRRFKPRSVVSAFAAAAVLMSGTVATAVPATASVPTAVMKATALKVFTIPARPYTDGTYRVRGTVNGKTTRPVWVQKAVGRSWKTVGVAPTSRPRGKFTVAFKVELGIKGTYRVYVPANAGYRSSVKNFVIIARNLDDAPGIIHGPGYVEPAGRLYGRAINKTCRKSNGIYHVTYDLVTVAQTAQGGIPAATNHIDMLLPSPMAMDAGAYNRSIYVTNPSFLGYGNC